MRAFEYENSPAKYLTPEITNAVSAIHEYKGKQELYLEAKPDILNALGEMAKIQSTEASNGIEGIGTSSKRLREIVEEKSKPKTRDEEEIAGYRDVLAIIHENYDHIEITPSIILHLHRDLYAYTMKSFGGSWKSADNSIIEYDEKGNRSVRFQPLSAVATPMAIEELCESYDHAIVEHVYDPLVLTCMFVFDFICIHPFNDGNGRMSRLLTLLLLYRSGYFVGKYISIERVIEQSKETYYDALRASSSGWLEGKNDYGPFIRYMLGVILRAYKDFSERVEGVSVSKLTKQERVKAVFDKKVGKVAKNDIRMECPDISERTIARALSDLQKSGYIDLIGGGRNAAYAKRSSDAT